MSSFINTKLKIIALGTSATLNWLSASISGEELDLKTFLHANEVFECLRQEKFDLVLIDMLHEEAAEACTRFVELDRAPVALVIRETEVDWQKLCYWEVDGFISDAASKNEIVARILALIRRSKQDLVTS